MNDIKVVSVNKLAYNTTYTFLELPEIFGKEVAL